MYYKPLTVATDFGFFQLGFCFPVLGVCYVVFGVCFFVCLQGFF